MNAVSTGTRASAVVSDVAPDSAPISGGPQTKPAQPRPDTAATPTPGWIPGRRPAALKADGTTAPRPSPRTKNPIDGDGRGADGQRGREADRGHAGEDGQHGTGAVPFDEPVAEDPDDDHRQRERGVAQAADGRAGAERVAQVDRRPVGRGALAEHRRERDAAEQQHRDRDPPAAGAHLVTRLVRRVGQHAQRQRAGQQQGNGTEDEQLAGEGTPTATPSVPTPAPANAPIPHQACMPFISGRFLAFSTVIACVFIAMSRPPWNAPQTSSVRNSSGTEPTTPINGPLRQ